MSATPVPPNTASSVNGIPAFVRILIPAVIALGLGGFLTWQFLGAIHQRKLDIETEAVRAKARACGQLKPTPISQALGKFPISAPDFVAEDVDGKPVKLSAYRGKVVFLNFWAPWCPPCVEETPSLESMTTQLANEPDLEIVGVAHEAEWDKIRAFFPKGTGMTILRDPSGQAGNIGKAWGTTKIPDTYLIDREGRVLYWFENLRQWDSTTALACVRSLLDDTKRE